jgi:RNA polymerase sigma-70 factor (ECF subfamily)
MEPPRTDIELVRKILDGEIEEYRALVRKYRGLVYHIVHYMISNETDREDIGQDVFLKVYQALPSFQFRSGLATWISRITYNTCRNYYRRRQSHLEDGFNVDSARDNGEAMSGIVEMSTIPTQAPAPDEVIIKKETADFVRTMVRTLPPQYRVIVILYYLEEFDVNEISKTIGIPVGTVKSHLFRARKMLKDRILARCNSEDLHPWNT